MGMEPKVGAGDSAGGRKSGNPRGHWTADSHLAEARREFGGPVMDWVVLDSFFGRPLALPHQAHIKNKLWIIFAWTGRGTFVS